MSEKEFLKNKAFISYMLIKDPDSVKYWETYLLNNPHDKISFEKAKSIFKRIRFQSSSLSIKERDALYHKILNNQVKKKAAIRKRILFKTYLAVAASILIVFLFTTYKTDNTALKSTIYVKQVSESHEIELITSDKSYTLASNETLSVTKTGEINLGTAVIKNTNETSYNTLKVPYGKRTKMTLVDGSKLWINAGSTVKFPSSFNDNNRSIYVEGEIYIEVAKDKSKPFIVKTSDFDVKVYGTIFDLKAYKNSLAKQVFLFEGSVSVSNKNKELMMVPNELVKIEENKFTKEKFVPENYNSWRKGYLTFKDKPLQDILIELSRYYNVSFSEISKNSKNNKCTGKIHLSTNLNDVLETLTILSGTTFEMDKN
ncbi:FecR domain-containing protein [Wenyingzhuangia sp. 1_MG-2023]|nr:FecR domain-containing protein [Wenyingzhuangia sp. 1_MG-2023]